eukprot:TRINITY_DN3724_c0_g1_i1.p1 TRINITY_DN3724_c0_g1~~TRINITY_DN3724_c0_g1_i1.p1  ORF type:complete len:294 (+),score=20.12 TRINITY_DN3724_c0_g1_i1:532-1413(+)
MNVSDPHNDKVRVRIKSRGVIGPKYAGEAQYPLCYLPFGREENVWINIFKGNKPKGNVHIGITAINFGTAGQQFLHSIPSVFTINSNCVREPGSVPPPLHMMPPNNALFHHHHHHHHNPHDDFTSQFHFQPIDNVTISPSIQLEQALDDNDLGNDFKYYYTGLGPINSINFPRWIVYHMSLPSRVSYEEEQSNCNCFCSFFQVFFLMFCFGVWIPFLMLTCLIGCALDIFQLLIWILTLGYFGAGWWCGIEKRRECNFLSLKVLFLVIIFPCSLIAVLVGERSRNRFRQFLSM